MSLEIGLSTAKRLYPDAPDWFKQELESQFGEKTLQKRKFTDIKTFEDACEELGISTAQFNGGETHDEQAYKKLKIVVKAINQGWTPDWNNSNQRKWWPYFNLSSGFGFSAANCGYDLANSGVGSRLCFESSEKAEYAGKQFSEIYKAFLT